MSESNDDRPHPTVLDADAQLSVEYWRQQTAESKALISRLTARLRGRDRRIELLELAIARTVLMHHVWTLHLERKLERPSGLGNIPGARDFQCAAGADGRPGSVTVHLPHVTRTLEALFDVMGEFWSDWDPERPPKSSTVARAIDEKLGLKGQANGEASRSAQTFAAAIRPDSLSESDSRHR
ncbi:hypothetical protein KPB04_25255 [Burkholderia cenocepacia]|uniref:hypothetical protein n=1 Tax=Burkholderia cenocepacia TaxID=95486 RepID=UPI0028596486|nr:hypothetical protein [Burkholderia cenocepacia]MDR8105038.1 hypothetical protein [Burkholderia cenocepacia]